MAISSARASGHSSLGRGGAARAATASASGFAPTLEHGSQSYGGLYLGTYASTPPLVASFRASNGANACCGSYNAFTGSQAALFDVYCDDGRAGWADTVLDRTGRNGIGQLTLNDGTMGEIVFGYVPLGQATPFPYTDVWPVPAPSANESRL